MIFILKVDPVFFQDRAKGIGRAPVQIFAGRLTADHKAFDGRARKNGSVDFSTRMVVGFGRHMQNTENVPTDIAPISRRGLGGSPKGTIAVGDRGIERPVEFPGRFKKRCHAAGDVPVRCQVPGKPLPEETPARRCRKTGPEDGLQSTGQDIEPVQLGGGFLQCGFGIGKIASIVPRQEKKTHGFGRIGL